MNPSYSCPNCHVACTTPKDTNLTSLPFAIGDVYLCGDCGCVSTFGLFNLVELTETEFCSLTPDEAEDLQYAARMCLKSARRQGAFTRQIFLKG